MKKLFWILRYAQHMNKRSRCGMRYGIYDEKVFIAEFDEWEETTPKDAADESISYWDVD